MIPFLSFNRKAEVEQEHLRTKVAKMSLHSRPCRCIVFTIIILRSSTFQTFSTVTVWGSTCKIRVACATGHLELGYRISIKKHAYPEGNQHHQSYIEFSGASVDGKIKHTTSFPLRQAARTLTTTVPTPARNICTNSIPCSQSKSPRFYPHSAVHIK